VVAGVVASQHAWNWFDGGWTELLKAGRIAKFRMSDFENRRGEFAAWPEDFRREFLKNLLYIFRKLELFPFGVATLMSDWNAMPAWRRDWFKDPYSIGVSIVIQAVAQSFPKVEKINFIFDRVPRLKGAALEAYEFARREKDCRDLVGSFEFASSEERKPLQAADFVAYEYGKFARNKLFDTQRPPRWTVERLGEMPHLLLATQFSDDPRFERWL
jgi:hypothetical protein